MNNRTFSFQIIDEKTAMTVGEMSYNLSLLLEKNNLAVTQQPYNLQKAEADSKLVLSMSLHVNNWKFYIYFMRTI